MIKEDFAYSNYSVSESVLSQIDKDKIIRVEKGFKCPQCKTLLPTLEHNKTKICPECALQMTRSGNLLECIK